MNKVILVRYGEIHLKGLNRPHFEKLLMDAMKKSMRRFEGAVVTRGDGRYYVHGVAEDDFDDAISALTKVFGIHSISPAIEMEKDLDAIYKAACELTRDYMDKYNLSSVTFKVEAKRSDKRFKKSSMEIAMDAGGYLLEHVEGLKVDVHKPKLKVYIEIRENAFVYVDIIPGQGGMPMRSNGKAALLLSGGIDSPVAGHMIAKRGVEIEAVHYHSFPYTSERAKQKVLDLAKILTEYTGPIKIHMVHFTEIQTTIYEKCPHEMLVIIMRRFMMRIAEHIAKESECKAIVTGESIGQVASQTIESMYVTNDAVSMPVFRPLIGMDKTEIIERAEKIGTFETSIQPYEDCCTVFVPKHPATKPQLEKVLKYEQELDIDALIEGALAKTEVIVVK